MPLYEHVFIARQDISQQQVDTLADELSGMIESGGGKVEKREYWGLRTLAYRVNKNRKGHYCLFNIDAPHEAVSEMERQMRINEDVLRYMTLRVDELEENESAMMRNRNRGDDRRRDRDDRRGDRGGDRNDREDRRPPPSSDRNKESDNKEDNSSESKGDDE